MDRVAQGWHISKLQVAENVLSFELHDIKIANASLIKLPL